ncbi:MAG: rhamnulokinase [Actinobacteria bacterium]|nr:MAG: rhamnulokinase [Actinomycetota bacterium]
MTTALAVDLGSSSGRVLAGTLTGKHVDVTKVHRFAHEAQRRGNALVWDLDRLWEETVSGLKKAAEQFPDAVSISVDTWGVDFVPLDANDEPIGLPHAYRDERTARTLDKFRARINDREFFDLTGIQPATINSANQLVALSVEEPELASRIASFLFLPDYFAWKLTGVKGWSRTIASTSGLCEPGGKQWNDEVFSRLGLDRGWVGEMNDDLTVVGQCTVPGLEHLTVVRGGAHDTACAVHGLPIDEGVSAYFLSAGSWSVLGAMLDHPLTSEAAFKIGLTNEARTDGGVRPLFNITGMWILQELQRQWEREGTPTDTDELVAQARECSPCEHVFDPDDPRFIEPGEMVEKIDACLKEQGATPPKTMPDYVRLVIESFAVRYSKGVKDLAKIVGEYPDQLNLVGGGARNHLLCDLTAKLAHVRVVAGPIEASILGSLLSQFEVMGHLDPADRSAVIAATAQTRVHTP